MTDPSVVRIAVASTPLTATLAEAVPAAIAAVEEAGAARRADRLPAGDRPCRATATSRAHVPDVAADELDARWTRSRPPCARRRRHDRRHRAPDAGRPRDRLRRARRRRQPARRAGKDADRPDRGALVRRRQRSAHVHGRRPDVRHRDLPRGFRYPEISRALALDGAQVIFVPHWVVTEGGPLPTRWMRRVEPVQREGADVPRAREHRLRRASNNAGPNQGSATGIVGPDGSLVARCRTARWASSRPTSTCAWPTAGWPGAGRRSATRCSDPDVEAAQHPLAPNWSLRASAGADPEDPVAGPGRAGCFDGVRHTLGSRETLSRRCSDARRPDLDGASSVAGRARRGFACRRHLGDRPPLLGDLAKDRLERADPGLDLHQDDIVSAIQPKVGRPPTRSRDRRFDSPTPRRMASTEQCLDDPGVGSIMDERRVGRVDGDPEFSTERRCSSALILAETFASPCSIRQMTDRETSMVCATADWLTPARSRIHGAPRRTSLTFGAVGGRRR